VPDFLKKTNILINNLKNNFSLYPRIGVEYEFYLQSPTQLDIEETLKEVAEYTDRIEGEKGWNQYECILEHSADINLLSRRIRIIHDAISMIARKNGVQANFQAKPFENDYGSALHFHLSLHDCNSDINIFEDDTINDNKTLQSIISALLTHTDEIINNVLESEDDFKRFEPNYMAPTHISWGGNNRTTIIRVPDGKKSARRIEYRLFPSSCNFEKALYHFLFYAFKGLEEEYPPFPRIYGNAFDAQYKLTQIQSKLI
jgi:glutamine synthetase